MVEISLVMILLMIISGLIKGFVGFGLSLLLISVLLDFGIAPNELMPILVPLFVILDLCLYWEHRKHMELDYKTNFALHPSTLIWLFLGTLCGSYVLVTFNVEILKLAFAFVILLSMFLLVLRINNHAIIVPDEKQNGLFGAITGLLTGIFTINAIPTTIYLLYHQYPKEKYMVTLVTFLLISDVILVAIYLYTGLFTLSGFLLSLQLLLFVLIGFSIGTLIRKHVSPTIFKRVVMIVLLLSAFKIIFEFFL